jgi:phenylacetate-coenzyme A ligase PaaK-like adenylate-forming protein
VNCGRFYNEALEKMPRRELLELRDRRLRWTVRHAYEKQPLLQEKVR